LRPFVCYFGVGECEGACAASFAPPMPTLALLPGCSFHSCGWALPAPTGRCRPNEGLGPCLLLQLACVPTGPKNHVGAGRHGRGRVGKAYQEGGCAKAGRRLAVRSPPATAPIAPAVPPHTHIPARRWLKSKSVVSRGRGAGGGRRRLRSHVHPPRPLVAAPGRTWSEFARREASGSWTWSSLPTRCPWAAAARPVRQARRAGAGTQLSRTPPTF
jgi:hypothetical protein